MFHRILTSLLLFTLLFSTALILSAQDGDVYADGLTNPRNLSFDSDGNLYVAEAGVGGSQVTDLGDNFGASGQVTMITPDGNSEIALMGFTSFDNVDSRGLSAVQVTDESYWVLLGENRDQRIPWSDALVELDRGTNRVMTYVDLHTIELEQDPDGNPNGEVNATDFAVGEDGTFYIVGAGCNCLLSWSAGNGVAIVTAWDFETDNPVPTSIEIGPDGDIYVGFLTGFPFPPEGSRIERWSGGELAQTYPGLTAVTGLLVTDDGTIYASEFGVFEMGVGWGAGRVVMVNDDGITPILEGVEFPFGLAQAPDGTIVVATGGSSGEGAGQVLVVPGM